MALVKKRTTIQIWISVIFAIFLREIKRKFSDKLGIGWSVVSPLVFIMVLTLLRGSIEGGVTHTVPTFFFMVYGILLVRFFIDAVNSISGAINASKPLFSFRQVQPISALISVGLFELLSRIFVFVSILMIAYFLKIDIYIENVLGLIFCFISIWLMAFSLGGIFSLVSCYVPEMVKIRSMLLRPLIFVSGAFFSLQDIPKEYWKYFTWNPVLHAIEYTRYFSYPTYKIEGTSFTYLSLFAVSLFFLFICTYRICWKSAISR